MSINSEYNKLKKVRTNGLNSINVFNQIKRLYNESHSFLQSCAIGGLLSEVPGKNYFAFIQNNNELSRPINNDLYSKGIKKIDDCFLAIQSGDFSTLTESELTESLYVITISYCAAKDILTKKTDKKTPGTFFEILVGHLFSKCLQRLPKKRLEILNLDMEATLPTDFIFDLGKNKPKFHVPVKTSTRERIIQVYGHQRVLDGVYGVGRFWGTLVCLAETKLETQTGIVIEICLPFQWQLYQMYIAQMKRIYYLDIPDPYKSLNNSFPKIPVVPFGQFFKEINSLAGII